MYHPNDVLPHEDEPVTKEQYQFQIVPCEARLQSHQILADNPSDFAAYLANFADHETVGIRAAPTACPLARYLSAHGVAFPAVTDGQYGQYLPGQRLLMESDEHELADPHFLPDWAVAFVELIDANTEEVMTLVSAGEAREALDKSLASLASLQPSQHETEE